MADTHIAFRSSAELREGLRQLGRRQGRSMQAILEDFVAASEGETPRPRRLARRVEESLQCGRGGTRPDLLRVGRPAHYPYL